MEQTVQRSVKEKAALKRVSKTHKKCQVVIWKMPTVRNANWQDWSLGWDLVTGHYLWGPRVTPPMPVSQHIIMWEEEFHKTRNHVYTHYFKHPTYRHKEEDSSSKWEIFCLRPRSGVVTKRPKLFWIHLLFCRILNWLNYLIEVSYCMQEPVETS